MDAVEQSSTADRRNWKSAALFAFSVLLLLVVARLILHIPKPLLMTSGVIFLGWCITCYGLQRRVRTTPICGRTLPLISVWLLTTALSMGVVYNFDRAGWIWFRLTGYDLVIAEDLSDQIDTSVAHFAAHHPFFSINPANANSLLLKKGEYDIDRTIVVPRGLSLTIEPGTILRFGAGRSLISYGPVNAKGTEDQPILFTARNKWLKWGVVAVVNAAEISVFEYVTFEHGRRAVVNGILFPGSLSMIGADAEIFHSQFINLFGKDGVYIREAKATIKDNLFKNTYKDGLDFDGGAGEISGNRFIDCEDEGIDLGGNYNLQVFGNEILDRRGGRIAADKYLDRIKSQNSFGYSQKDGHSN